MGQVFVTTYEVIGTGDEIAEKHYAAVDAARKAQWSFAESVGGIGFRPEHNGSVRSVMFETLPSGWRQTGREGKKIEALPRKSTKVGKALYASMRDLPRAPQAEELARSFGYNPSELAMDTSRGVIYFPTEMRVQHPSVRTFLRIPRFDGDGFEPNPEQLRAVPESELMKAIEDHNAEARRQKELAKQKQAA